MPPPISGFQAAYISVEVLIALVSVPGNVLVIWAVKVNQALRDATFCFIASLAVADVAVGALVIPARHPHQHRAADLLPHLPHGRLPRAHPHSELHPGPAGHRCGPLPPCQDPAPVSLPQREVPATPVLGGVRAILRGRKVEHRAPVSQMSSGPLCPSLHSVPCPLLCSARLSCRQSRRVLGGWGSASLAVLRTPSYAAAVLWTQPAVQPGVRGWRGQQESQ